MAFLNDLGKKLGGVAEAAAEKAKIAAEAAADKAKEIAEVTKLNGEIATEQKQIDKLYLEIGKIIFEREKANPESPVAEQCQKISAAETHIAELNLKIQQVKARDDQAKTEPIKPTEAAPAAAVSEPAAGAQKKFCTNCGAELPEGSRFCQSCGAAVN